MSDPSKINTLNRNRETTATHSHDYRGVPTGEYEDDRAEKPWQRVFRGLRKNGSSLNEPVRSVPSTLLILVLGVYMLLGYLTQLVEDDMPAIVREFDVPRDNSDTFSEESAQRFLNRIIGKEPRVSGTAYHLSQTADLKDMLDDIAAQAKQVVKTDWQIASGDYFHKSSTAFFNMYQNASNIIALLEGESGFHANGTIGSSILVNCHYDSVPFALGESGFHENGTIGSSILVNCHYDSVPFALGASDNAAFCAIMAEALVKLSRRTEKLKRNIVFLFNGAEENGLQASHAFLQHPWAKGVTAVINLDAGGMNGKATIFQVTDPRVLNAYHRAAVRPNAQGLAEFLFSTGIIPSDTDFRIWRDFGNIQGVDIAFVKWAHVYHTRNDRPELILPGVLQCGGDMLLALLKETANIEELDEQVRSCRPELILPGVLQCGGDMLLALLKETANIEELDEQVRSCRPELILPGVLQCGGDMLLALLKETANIEELDEQVRSCRPELILPGVLQCGGDMLLALLKETANIEELDEQVRSCRPELILPGVLQCGGDILLALLKETANIEELDEQVRSCRPELILPGVLQCGGDMLLALLKETANIEELDEQVRSCRPELILPGVLQCGGDMLLALLKETANIEELDEQVRSCRPELILPGVLQCGGDMLLALLKETANIEELDEQVRSCRPELILPGVLQCGGDMLLALLKETANIEELDEQVRSCRPELILPGVLQCGGDMLLALLKETANIEELDEQIEPTAAVYYDYLNVFLVTYSFAASYVVDVFIALLGLASVSYYVWLVGARWSTIQNLLFTVLGRLAAVVAGLLVVAVCVLLMVATTVQMRYLPLPWLVVPLYWIPYLVGAVAAAHVFDAWRLKKNGLNRSLRCLQAMTATRLLLSVILLVLVCIPPFTSLRYLFSAPLFIMSFTALASITAVKYVNLTGWQHLLLEVCLSLPSVMFMYSLALRVNAQMLPIMNRSSDDSPDITVAMLNAGLAVIVSSTISGIELLFSRKRLWMVLSLLGAVCFILMFIPFSPYDADGIALQRHYWFHSEIVSYDINNATTSRTSGIVVTKLDPYSTERVLPALESAGHRVSAQTDLAPHCEERVYCGVPLFRTSFSRYLRTSLRTVRSACTAACRCLGRALVAICKYSIVSYDINNATTSRTSGIVVTKLDPYSTERVLPALESAGHRVSAQTDLAPHCAERVYCGVPLFRTSFSRYLRTSLRTVRSACTAACRCLGRALVAICKYSIVSYDINNATTSRTSGIVVTKLDPYSTERVLPALESAGHRVSAQTDLAPHCAERVYCGTDLAPHCEERVYCGVPLFRTGFSRYLSKAMFLYTEPPAPFAPPVALRVDSRVCSGDECRYRFVFTGGHHNMITFWARDNITMTSWSLNSPPQVCHELLHRPVYVIYHSAATYNEQGVEFSIDVAFKVPPSQQSQAIVDVSHHSHKIHHPEDFTSEYSTILNAMPAYFNVASFLSFRHDYVF
ncbi:hypothetical protein PYW07_010622 [Mythimna separata]|uniref:FXNA-like protease n=1 Tax=Mythimna separata TaxID=271217 RepID=A0AAD7YAY7_MYTSE|nr:hypothetical protein PYW07_010622 [Mythimna separata]